MLALLIALCSAISTAGRPARSALRRSPSRSSVALCDAASASSGVSPAWEFDPLEAKSRGRRPKLLKTGSDYVRAEALESGANKFEKMKNEKDGTAAWTEIHELSAKLRAGECTWEELNLDDINLRLKWAGFFHRPKEAPRTFMVRLKVPNGVITAAQARVFADLVEPYGPKLGVVDITTRQNIQLRGITLEDASHVADALLECGLGSFMSGLDNVRNLVGSPIAGLDPHELVDTRPVCAQINSDITGAFRGNPEWANLPRKFNIAVSGSRDDFSHTTINDIGLQAAVHPDCPSEPGFNIVLGGYFSIKRVAESIPMGAWVSARDAPAFSLAVLEVFRDYGRREDRQKTRLMWLLEERGLDWFRAMVNEILARRGVDALRAAAPPPADAFSRRDLLGVHTQRQEGKSWVGVTVPVGRLSVGEVRVLADLADKYSAGEIRLTVEQNALLPNVDTARVPELLAEPALHGGRLRVEHELSLMRGLVSCTGSEFCGQGLVETKHRAVRVAERLDAELELPRLVRLHWTGCPNSCGQAQVGDIGLMGAPAKKLNPETGKMMGVEGVQVFLGGEVGEHPELGSKFETAVPADDDELVPHLRELLISKFGATPRK
ncbi:hypothetical protein KFE25_006882 [Diacronema lutheri]|uniref:Ferredoxin--nitrite reductase, chloroplastic n=2 Tax=Diacronema lutheri TaxID=2081491 RepID=A0A8J5XYI8_DIALT|nr:hypothetical protein KFE25_006882 [Diacronema lutheri]